MDKNHKAWDSPGVVDFYRRRISEGAQKPEVAIFDMLGDISHATLLDIGIGTGRTTAFLNNRVSQYTGIDYSERMIAECKKFFKNTNLILKQADARKLSGFQDNSYDICFFSFNGIDYITDDKERDDTIQEIRRVLKPGVHFVFSSHNLYNLPMRLKLFHPGKKLSYSIRCIIRSMIYRQLSIHNFDQIKVFDLYGSQVQDHFEKTYRDYYLYYSCKKKCI